MLTVACAGAVIAFCTGDRTRFLVLALAFAALVVPIYQAHVGTAFSLDKHMSAGDGLASIAAGYTFSKMRVAALRPAASTALAVALLTFPAITGLWYARTTFHYWANVGRLLPALRAVSDYGPQPIYINSANGSFTIDLFWYYLSGDDWRHWQDNSPSSLARVKAGGYSVVVTSLNASSLGKPTLPESALYGRGSLNGKILSLSGSDKLINALVRGHKYHIARVIPYESADPQDQFGLFVIWVKS